ncbi:hypothetical protein [Amycolatopsis sp. cmx-4-61]|uniref:hypothetical protein n=1 Tax=Amycolatopsis sp. cmx-4-61 TaxID=2790937 RepID=UPI00397AD24D
MDEDYARKLRDWLRAEPGATPDGTSEEREWLREIPEPASEEQAAMPDRWTVRGRLPVTPADDDWVCPVIVLPVPRPSRENGCRMSGVEVRLRWTRPAEPDAGRMSDAEARSRWNHPTNADRRAPGRVTAADPTADRRDQAADSMTGAEVGWADPAADRRDRASDSGSMTGAEVRWADPAADRRDRAADSGLVTGAEVGWADPTADRRDRTASSMTGAEVRWADPTADRRSQSTEPNRKPEPAPMTEAEARSRWNHPTNWHRRRRAAEGDEQRRRDQPGSR